MEHLTLKTNQLTVLPYRRIRLLTAHLLFLFIVLANVGCGSEEDCSLIDCPDGSAFLELRILQNGQDIIFGDSPTLTPEEIVFQSVPTTIFQEEFGPLPVGINSLITLEDRIGVSIVNTSTITLELGELAIVSIIVETVIVQTTSVCCRDALITRIEIDGETVCASDCTTLDIEID